MTTAIVAAFDAK